MLWLVRHGQPLIDRSRPAHDWPLDPDHVFAVDAMRARLPSGAAWFSSPEPKAHQTALRLADRPVTVVDELREHRRDSPGWIDDFPGTVRRAFARPDAAAVPGWEPLTALRDRLVPAVRRILAAHPGDVVLAGHGTAWTVLVGELTGAEPDLDRWGALAMPDLLVLDRPDLSAS